jgi:hypothetical protein
MKMERLAESHVSQENFQLRKPIHLKYYIKLLMQNESFVELKLRISQRKRKEEIFASLKQHNTQNFYVIRSHSTSYFL